MREKEKKNKSYNLRYLIFESIEIFSFKQKVKTIEYFLIPHYVSTKFMSIREQSRYINMKQGDETT